MKILLTIFMVHFVVIPLFPVFPFFFLFLSGSLYIIHALLLTLNLMIYLVKVYAYYILNLLGQTKCPWHVGCSTLKTEFNKSKEY